MTDEALIEELARAIDESQHDYRHLKDGKVRSQSIITAHAILPIIKREVDKAGENVIAVSYDCGIRAGQEEERAAIVAWLLEEEKDYPAGEYSVFVAMVRRELEAGEHRK